MSANHQHTSPVTPEQVAQLEHANRLKAEFIANVSHELRTPVHAIIGYTDLLLEGIYEALTGDQEETVSYIRESAKDLLSLINNLLDLSRIESGRADLILTTFDLRDLISELIGQLKPLADAKHITLASKVTVDDATIRTDYGKLKQILVNLVGNSLKFTEQGTVTLHVATSPAAKLAPYTIHNNRLLLSVEDTGVGIPTEQLKRVFDKFYQVDSSVSRRHEGTGLGLYITKQLLDLLAGTVEIRSSVGQGTTVTISLPKNYQETDGIQLLRKRIAAAAEFINDEVTPDKRLVLAISDDADITKILADGLGSSEYTVRAAPANSEAVAMAIKLRPLVILLNAENSSSDMWSVFQELKNHPGTKNIPTIFLSNDSNRGLGTPLAVSAPLNHKDVLRSVRAVTSTGKKNILIVDDEGSFREILKCALGEEGYQINEASNGRDALKKLDELTPDLLLLDLRMPDLDGWGVMQHITKNPRLENMNVLVITGDMLTENESAALKDHAQGLINKADFKVNNVLQQVADLLEVK